MDITSATVARMKTYQGSCSCKRVRFEADIDFDKGTTRCNCTSCVKRRWWSVQVKPAQFRPLEGASELTQMEGQKLPGGFCKHCGIFTYAYGEAAEWNDGDYVAINVAALDGLDPDAMRAIPIKYLDGLHDTWAPIEGDTRYL
jgi:hypothetical protein